MNIPEELKRLAQWVLWRYEKHDDGTRGGKKPYQVAGQPANVGNPATWCDFETATKQREDRYDGIGFVFSHTDPYVGVDFDGCKKSNGTIVPWAAQWLEALDSYSEVSPSGEGVKVWIRASLPERCKHTVRINAPSVGEKDPAIEVYGAGRYFAVTGQQWGERSTIEERQQQLDALLAHFGMVSPPAPAPAPAAHNGGAYSEADYARCYLDRLAPWRCDDYNQWLAVGMALKALGSAGLDLWDSWSRQSSKYQEGECARRWHGFKLDQGGIGKLGKWAKDDDPRPTQQPHYAPRQTSNQTRGGERPAALADASPPTSGERDRPGGPGRSAVTSGEVPAVSPYELIPDLDDLAFVVQCASDGDVGDVRLLEKLYSGRLVYDHKESAWFYWAGHVWQLDEVGMVWVLLDVLIEQYYRAMGTIQRKPATMDEHEAKKLKDHQKECSKKARHLQGTAARRNVMTLAQSYLPMTSTWDTKPWLLAVANGVVDLRTGELHPGNPTDYLRTATPTPYDPNAKAPRWERFIREIMPDPETAAYLQRLLGFGITGLTLHILPILWGPGGRNGKSELIRTLSTVLGRIAGMVHNDAVAFQGERKAGSAQPYLVDLQGKRLAFASETSEGERLNEAQVKNVTGGDQVRARALYEGLREFEPTHLLFLVTNWLPRASSEDTAIWERLRVVRFDQRFVRNPDPNKPNEHQADPHLADKLTREAPGILTWLVRGCLTWQERGGEDPPERVRVETDAMRDDNDLLGHFIADCCVSHSHASVRSGELYEEYTKWCEQQGYKKPQHSLTSFGRKMGARFENKKGKRGRLYFGIGIRTGENGWVTGCDGTDGDSGQTRHPSQSAIESHPDTPGGYQGDGLTANPQKFLYPHAHERKVLPKCRQPVTPPPGLVKSEAQGSEKTWVTGCDGGGDGCDGFVPTDQSVCKEKEEQPYQSGEVQHPDIDKTREEQPYIGPQGWTDGLVFAQWERGNLELREGGGGYPDNRNRRNGGSSISLPDRR